MTAAKHTPGPWFLCVEDGEKIAFYVFAKSQLKNERISIWDDFIARAGLNHENFEANAQLIASAPDLLAALQALVADFGGTVAYARASPQATQARAAINKATGEAV